MTRFSFFILFCSLTSIYGGNKHGNDIDPEKIEREQYDNDKIACELHRFDIKGYGEAKCTYVVLRSLLDEDNKSLEYVCLPDHCGLFENDSQTCQQDIYCVWEDDDSTQRSHISRCYPACFNNIDIMFLVDGSTSQISSSDSNGVSDFDKNVLAIQQFVKNNIRECATNNITHEVREWYLAFGARADKDEFPISESLTFKESEKLSQNEASTLVNNLYAPSDEMISLIEYVTNKSNLQVGSSQFLESLKKRELDVLYLVDPIDEYAVEQLKDFNYKKLQCVTKEGLKLPETEEKNKCVDKKSRNNTKIGQYDKNHTKSKHSLLYPKRNNATYSSIQASGISIIHKFTLCLVCLFLIIIVGSTVAIYKIANKNVNGTNTCSSYDRRIIKHEFVQEQATTTETVEQNRVTRTTTIITQVIQITIEFIVSRR